MEILRSITLFINNFFLYYITIYVIVLFVSAIAGLLIFYFENRKKRFKNEINRDYYLSVSIIVPAYNEEVTIVDTVESLLKLDYKLYEIIVVDDGSKDNTLQRLIDKYELTEVNKVVCKQLKTKPIKKYYASSKYPKLTVIEKENGGKSDALNVGINASSSVYFLTIDADTILQRNSLTEIVKPIMEDNSVVAVGGVIKLSNEFEIRNGKIIKHRLPLNPVEIFQCLEYDRTFLAGRTVFDLYNGNLIISGAFGLFKKSIVIDVKGYKTNTIGEDMELVMRIHDYCITSKIKYKIKYEPKAICYTQAPNSMKDLKKQRKRWHTGLIQSLFRHKEMFLNPKYKALGSLSYLYYLIYELLAPITETVGLIFVVLSYFLGMSNIRFMLIYLIIYVMFCTIYTITTFFNRTYTTTDDISFKDFVKVVIYSFLENFGYRQLINLYRLESFITYTKNKSNWDKIERTKMGSI